MNVSSEQLIYLAIIKQACRDYIDWKRTNNSRLIEVKSFLLQSYVPGLFEVDGKYLIDLLDDYAATSKKKFWRQDIVALYNILDEPLKNAIKERDAK